jgi:hypothetical protein
MGGKRAKVEKGEQTTPLAGGSRRRRPKVKRGDKPRAVQEAPDKGMSSPSGIAICLRGLGIEITPAHVTTIKAKLKKQGAAGGKSQEGRSATKEQPTQEPVAQPAARDTTSSGPGLTPGDLTSPGAIAQRVGGIDRLQEFLHLLKKIK